MKKWSFLGGSMRIFSFLLAFLCFIQVNAQRNFLFGPTSNTPKEGTINLKFGKEVLKTENVTLNWSLLLDGPDTLSASLLDNPITISRKKNVLTPGRLFSWWGGVVGDPNSYVLFSKAGEVFAANILWKNTLYQIRYIGKDVYQTRQINQANFPTDELDLGDSPIKLKSSTSENLCTDTDSPFIIDVMVLYTDNVLAAAGAIEVVESEIYLTVHETNLAYLKSNVTQRIGLVHIEKLQGYQEKNNHVLDYNALVSDLSVLSKRDQYFADIVVLMVEQLNVCGVAEVMTSVSTSFENRAYAVVQRHCATGKYTFAHELAHIMGCRHQCSIVPSQSPYPFAHGYCFVDQGTKCATIVTDLSAYGATVRIPYFSNPNIKYNGTAIGTSGSGCQADDHQVLNLTASTVANFRCHSASTTNVWIKDSWNDTGAEPDPLTLGDDMWNSPDIWIRNQPDTFSHQHQNPNPGANNWVYVKLHNGGNSISGTLEIYYADASTIPTWPNSFQLLDAIPLKLNGYVSHLVESKWSVPANPVDYTLIARWVSSSDVITFPEGSDVAVNVRNNNNLAWKNLKIINLIEKTESKVVTSIMAKQGVSVELDFEDTFPAQSFASSGTVEVSFDQKTMQASGKYISGTGFKTIRKNLFLVTNSKVKFDNLGSDLGQMGEMTLRFRKTKQTPKQKYNFSIRQVVTANNLIKDKGLSGGIDYQINLDY